nr:probable (S)-N-methylcoclaurine 3'-hydroxylase isozyme 2 [Ipomoea batatas]
MPHITLTTFSKTYGPLISLKLGTQHLIVGSSPSAASEILKTHDRVLSGRHVPNAFPTETSELDHTSIGWTSECHEAWRSLRALCRAEMFCSRALESQALLREKKAGEMVGFLRSKMGSEEVVDVGEIVFATVLNMLSNVMLSRDVISFEGGEIKGFIRSVMEVASAPNLSDFYPFLQRLDLQGLRKRALGLGMRIRSMWEPIIEERREIRCGGGSVQQDFLDALLDNGFSNEKIHQLFMELFAAGTDTSTSTIEWAMAELIKSPLSMEKVYKELNREINGDNSLIRESHLVHLPYLQACVKETLRLHPPAPLLLPHRAIQACQVMDYTIPKDAQILINVWAVQRDASIWDEPLKFRPERFLGETGCLDFKGNDFEFLPFGAGRRICPGLPMAAKTIPLVLASMIHSFDWSLPDGQNPKDLNMNEKFGVTLQKEQPLFLIPKTRKNM